MNRSFGIIVAASMATAAPWLVAPAAATPISSLTGLQNIITPVVETVQYRHGGYRGRRIGGVGVGLGVGLGAGALIGGAILGAPRPYGRYGYGAYDPGYYDQGYTSVPPYVGGDEIAYCQQRFRSYDPASGTYLGFDGLRHSCP
jgi:BA14K-like protein